MTRHFNASSAQFWWPRRKDEETEWFQRPDHDLPSYRHEPLTTDRKILDPQLEDQEGAKRIYILGAGNLGAFVAHSLAGIPNRPSITLLLKRRQLQSFKACDSGIDVISRKITETRRGFEVELLTSPLPIPSAYEEGSESLDSELSTSTRTESDLRQLCDRREPWTASEDEQHETVEAANTASDSGDYETKRMPDIGDEIPANEILSKEKDHGRLSQLRDQGSAADNEAGGQATAGENVIVNLILSVKAPQTTRALQAVAHRLNHKSTIVFLQNGMGIIDEVNAQLFPDERHRPTYIIGVVSHGLHSNRTFSVVHAGEGTIALGVMPRVPVIERTENNDLSQIAPSARYLLRTMTRTPVLVAVGFPPTDLLQQQLDKLAINCIINPLTAIFECTNGALLSNFHFTRVTRLLLAEVSLVIKNLPELKNVPNVNMRFDTSRLEALVFAIAKTTANNTSSMLQDLRSGKQTEIDYINNYIVKRGEEMGVHCVMNYMLVQMIKGKRKISQEQPEVLPFARPGRDR